MRPVRALAALGSSALLASAATAWAQGQVANANGKCSVAVNAKDGSNVFVYVNCSEEQKRTLQRLAEKQAGTERRLNQVERDAEIDRRKVAALLEAYETVSAIGQSNTASTFDRRAAELLTLGEESDAAVVLGREAQEALSRSREAAVRAAGLYRQQATLLRVSRPDEALAALNLALSQVPDDEDALADAGDVALVLGKYELALGYFSRILKLGAARLRLPDSRVEGLRIEALGYRKTGDVQRARGMPEKALESYAVAIERMDTLVRESPPTESEARRGLATDHELAAEVLFAQGRLDASRQHLEQSIRIREALADVGGQDDQMGLAIAFRKLGDVQLAQGEFLNGVRSHETSLESLRLRDTQAILHLPLLALVLSDAVRKGKDVSLTAVAGASVFARMANAMDPARESYRTSMAASKRLLLANPNAFTAQYLYSVSLQGTGYVQVWNSDWAGAIESHEGSLAIRQNLMKAQPSVAAWSLAAAASYWDLGMLFEALQDGRKMNEMLTDGLRLVVALEQEGRLAGEMKLWPQRFREALERRTLEQRVLN